MRPKNQERRAIVSAARLTARQQAVPNRPPVIDYFVWPEVRNQIVTKGIHLNTGKAAIALADNFHFQWPFETRDAYKIRRSTGMYSLSEAFLARCDDISCYRVSLDNMLAYHFDRPWLPSSRLVETEDDTDSTDGVLVNVPSCGLDQYQDSPDDNGGIMLEIPRSDCVQYAGGANRADIRELDHTSWVETHTPAGIDHNIWLQGGPDWMVPFNQDLGGHSAPYYALDAFSIGQAQWSMA